MLAREGKARSFSDNARLAIVLSCVAGAVNATGFFLVGSYTSHVTGNVARIGDELAQGNWAVARAALALVVAFLLGAMLATLLVEGARRMGGRAHYKSALVVECGVLAAFTLLAAAGLSPQLLTAMLCFAMGLQNALVTKISGAIVRTTHLTGVTTDFGIELVQLWLWLRERSRGLDLRGRLRMARLILREPQLESLWLHFTIFASFLVGATVGPLLWLQVGALAMALPCGLLLVLLARETIAARRRIARPVEGRIAS